MLETIKKWLIKPKPEESGIPIDMSEIDVTKGDRSYFTRPYSFGSRSSEDEISIDLIDPVRRVKYPIMDNDGNFVSFPGIENVGLLKPYYNGSSIAPTICFRTDFYRNRECGKLMVHWQIQPDGRYWADEDGFGIENDLEITDGFTI